MRSTRMLLTTGAIVLLLSAAAGPSGAADARTASAPAAIESGAARARIESLRARLRTARAAAGRSWLAPGIATAFVGDGGAHVRAVIGVTTSADVELPRRADGDVRVRDRRSGMSVAFSLAGARSSTVTSADGLAVYVDALPGADVVHRVGLDGTEDFVAFAARPAREQLVQSVDVSGVAGLRQIGEELELLDASGTPRLRVASPWVVDATGRRHAAKLGVDGCAVDRDPRAPWGRPVVAPGAASCGVRVSWADANVAYPAMVDPYWATTGSMAAARQTATRRCSTTAGCSSPAAATPKRVPSSTIRRRPRSAARAR
jgi:hypothetical protein